MLIDDPRASKIKAPPQASSAPAGQPVEQTLSRVILMGINSATKEPQPINIDPESGGIQMQSSNLDLSGIAGSGLANSGTNTAPVLDVNVDNSTVEIATDTLQVKNSGISTAKIADDAVTGAKLFNGTLSGQLMIWDGSTWAAVAMSSDANISSSGVLTLTANSVGSTEIANNSVTTAKIASGNVTDASLRNGGARTVIGRSANSTGAVADISLATDGKFLGSRALVLGAYYPTQRLSKSTTYPLVQSDYGALVDCDTTSAGFTVTLPAPGTVGSGWWCTLRKIVAANVLTIARNASETINGASASNTLNSQYSYLTLMCDGTNWAVVGVNDYLSSSNGTPAGIGTVTTNHYADFTSLSVPPGEWEFSGQINFILNGGTITQIVMGISAGTSGNSFTDSAQGDNFSAGAPPTANNDATLNVTAWRKLFTATTTVYLKMRDSFTVQGLNVTGRLSARRVG